MSDQIEPARSAHGTRSQYRSVVRRQALVVGISVLVAAGWLALSAAKAGHLREEHTIDFFAAYLVLGLVWLGLAVFRFRQLRGFQSGGGTTP